MSSADGSSGLSTEAMLLIVIGVMGCIIVTGLTVGCFVCFRSKGKGEAKKQQDAMHGAIEFGSVHVSPTMTTTGDVETTAGDVDGNTPDSAPVMGADFSDGKILCVASMSSHSMVMGSVPSDEGALEAADITRHHHVSQINLKESMGCDNDSDDSDDSNKALYEEQGQEEAVPVLHGSPGSFVVTPGGSSGSTTLGAGTDLVEADGMESDARAAEDAEEEEEDVHVEKGMYDKDNKCKTAGRGGGDLAALYEKPDDKATKQ